MDNNKLKQLYNTLSYGLPVLDESPIDYVPTFARGPLEMPIETFAPVSQDNPDNWYQDMLGKWHRKPGSGPNI